MKFIFTIVLLLLISACSLFLSEDKISLVVLGDSTVADYFISDERRGWGQEIDEYLTSEIKVINIAKSGATCESFINEHLLDKALRRNAEYALIQFGHNDFSHGYTTKDYTSFLTRIVTDLKKNGTIPILVTPMHRIHFNADGSLFQDLQPFANAMKLVATENDLSLIDLYSLSEIYFENIGEEECLKLSKDRTHFNLEGARILAKLIACEISNEELELSEYVKL